MPGVGIIGGRYQDPTDVEKKRPTSLPPEARQLSRMLGLLKNSDDASVALVDAMHSLVLVQEYKHRQQQQQRRRRRQQHDELRLGNRHLASRKKKRNVHYTFRNVERLLVRHIEDLRSHSWNYLDWKGASMEMAMAMEGAFQSVFLGLASSDGKSSVAGYGSASASAEEAFGARPTSSCDRRDQPVKKKGEWYSIPTDTQSPVVGGANRPRKRGKTGYHVFLTDYFSRVVSGGRSTDGSGVGGSIGSSRSSSTIRKRKSRFSQGGIMQLAGKAWKALSSRDKKVYDDQAEMENARNGRGFYVRATPTTASPITPPPASATVSPRSDSPTTSLPAVGGKTAFISESEDGSHTITTTEEEEEEVQKRQQQVGEDSDSVDSDDDDDAESTSSDGSDERLDQELAMMDFWSNLLEAAHLEISSRTTRVWGKKKIYEVYQLAGPAMPLTSSIAEGGSGATARRHERQQQDIRSRVEEEFFSIYDGSAPLPKNDCIALRFSECRVYAAIRADPVPTIWIQINIGAALDVDDEMNRSVTGQKKKKPATEFVAVVVPESSLIALTASRAASRSRFTPYVLSALEGALTCSVVGGYDAEDAQLQRFGDLSGTEPHELLKSARDIESGYAVGRFANYASVGQATDPIADLRAAATGNLVTRRERLPGVSSEHGVAVASLSRDVAESSGGEAALAAANEAGIVVDHNASDKRKRKRRRAMAFGEIGDCPVRRRIRWDWTGRTTAAAASWLDATGGDGGGGGHGGGDDGKEEGRGSGKEDIDSRTRDLPSHTFKCRVVLQGEDVFAGMQALVDAGLMETRVPHYVKDAPGLGSSITVDHGAIVSEPNHRR